MVGKREGDMEREREGGLWKEEAMERQMERGRVGD
jgi:hypothetical protein